jgi:hypothetical protein
MVGILPDKYPNCAELEEQNGGVGTVGIGTGGNSSSSSSKQLAERFSQFSLKQPRQRSEDQKKHTNVGMICLVVILTLFCHY